MQNNIPESDEHQEYNRPSVGRIALLTQKLIQGIAVAAAAYAGRYSIQAWQAFKARPHTARLRKFHKGGFQSTMTKREAALILGVGYQLAPF
ncbi:hypothetical protein TB2_009338 [Malus domestica]